MGGTSRLHAADPPDFKLLVAKVIGTFQTARLRVAETPEPAVVSASPSLTPPPPSSAAAANTTHDTLQPAPTDSADTPTPAQATDAARGSDRPAPFQRTRYARAVLGAPQFSRAQRQPA
eukprot:5511347-Pleurochrysis_carterae.AAC.3